MIGWKAGYDADTPTKGTTTGSENVFIGGATEASSSTTSNEIVIGYNVTGKGANKAVIGNNDCTDVYMASDAGATVICTSVTLKETTTPLDKAGYGKVYTKRELFLKFQGIIEFLESEIKAKADKKEKDGGKKDDKSA